MHFTIGDEYAILLVNRDAGRLLECGRRFVPQVRKVLVLQIEYVNELLKRIRYIRATLGIDRHSVGFYQQRSVSGFLDASQTLEESLLLDALDIFAVNFSQELNAS